MFVEYLIYNEKIMLTVLNEGRNLVIMTILNFDHVKKLITFPFEILFDCIISGEKSRLLPNSRSSTLSFNNLPKISLRKRV